MSKKQKKTQVNSSPSGLTLLTKKQGFSLYQINSNGLTILHKQIKDTGVITTNITYKVGARDEAIGESGLAHMLEHMLFKPTKQDLKRKIDSGAMHFERETGCILNANTWKDRTTYFFNYPKKFYPRALQIEAERMQGVVISDTEFNPERGNVLSEFDMYNGDPLFAISVQMIASAFHSHPYGHETIGFREDIEQYTPKKLSNFYKQYYRPSNAVLMIIGDISLDEALVVALTKFGRLRNPKGEIKRHAVTEPKQEGLRRVEIVRETTTNLVCLGIKHAGFPTKEWWETSLMLKMLADGPDSILHKLLVDVGLATSLSINLEPVSEENLAILSIVIAQGVTHEKIERLVLETINALKPKDIEKALKKSIQRTLTEELFARSSSLHIAMELTEYVSADSFESFLITEQVLRKILPKDIIARIDKSFDQNKMVIGNFVGKK